MFKLERSVECGIIVKDIGFIVLSKISASPVLYRLSGYFFGSAVESVACTINRKDLIF
jgi:hypothetical protein